MNGLKPGDKVVIKRKGRGILNREFLKCYDKFGCCQIVSRSNTGFYIAVPNVSDSAFLAGKEQIINVITNDCLLLYSDIDKSSTVDSRINQFCSLFSE